MNGFEVENKRISQERMIFFLQYVLLWMIILQKIREILENEEVVLTNSNLSGKEKSKNTKTVNIEIIGYIESNGNCYLIFKIKETEKKVKLLKKQAEIEAMYPGFDNLLCLVTTTLNMYISDGTMTESFITDQLSGLLDKNINHDKNSGKYGSLKDFNRFSNDIAKGLGLDEYYEYCYDENGSEYKLKSEEAFYNLDPLSHPRQKNYGKYGIARYSNATTPERLT